MIIFLSFRSSSALWCYFLEHNSQRGNQNAASKVWKWEAGTVWSPIASDHKYPFTFVLSSSLSALGYLLLFSHIFDPIFQYIYCVCRCARFQSLEKSFNIFQFSKTTRVIQTAILLSLHDIFCSTFNEKKPFHSKKLNGIWFLKIV